MKQITTLIIAFIFVAGLAGCNGPKTIPNGSEGTASLPSQDVIPSGENTSSSADPTEEESPNVPATNVPEVIPDEDEGTASLPSQDVAPSGEDTSPSADPAEEESPNVPASMELKKLGSLQYYLYIPANPTSDMPLIIYLHGGTNKRAEVSALLTTEGFPKFLYEGYYGDLRAYVAIPKLDDRYKGWADISDQIRDLIHSLHTNYSINMDKISLTGHSMGGTGTYQLQTKLSNTFACIAPMSGSIQNSETNIAALCKTKVWAFVGTEDTIVNPDSSRAIIQALHEKGANAKITELEGATHFDVPSLAYKDLALIQWLVNCGE